MTGEVRARRTQKIEIVGIIIPLAIFFEMFYAMMFLSSPLGSFWSLSGLVGCILLALLAFGFLLYLFVWEVAH